MKNLIYIGLALLCLACATDPQKEMEKKLLGEWCNPYTYQSTGELKGFRFKKGGVCESINIPTLDLKTWEIQEGYLIIKGESIEEDGTREEYLTKEKIDQLNADSLSLLVTAGPPRIAFLYLNTKVIKDRVTPEK
ncbi:MULTISPECIES: lipocalin family protein [Butyricimonas]|uniref:lipocalin family protein n=1 Tax=Butyricimonas TaxID=574697 RepID=UPI0003773BC7|nr:MULTISPECIES: lipocalin family protein [Butyricimonas]